MTTQFFEDIESMKIQDVHSMNNVVKSVRYSLICVHEGQSVSNVFDVPLGDPEKNSFLSFDLLTKEQALEWVHASIGNAAMSDRKSAMIAMCQQINNQPVPEEVQPPWNKN
jgi:hypothetical protein